VEDVDGNIVRRDAYLDEMIRIFIFRLPMQGLTMRDAKLGQRIIEAVSSQKNGRYEELEFEDEDYGWLTGKFEELGPQVFGISAIKIKEALQPLEGNRADRRRKSR